MTIKQMNGLIRKMGAYYLESTPSHGRLHGSGEKVSPVGGEGYIVVCKDLLRQGRFVLPTGIGPHAH